MKGCQGNKTERINEQEVTGCHRGQQWARGRELWPLNG